MIIQHNIMALNAHRQLGGNNSLVSKNLEKLSSGFRINRAGDDAAGLAISEKMRAQITGLSRAQSNAQDGISLVQTAEGALTEVHSMLNRMVDLATQASNGTMKSDDRGKIQDEMNALVEEIDRISQSTNFNGINLLDGSMGGGKTGVVGAVTSDATKFDAATKITVEGLAAGSTVKLTATGTAADKSVAWNAATKELEIKVGKGNTITQEELDTEIAKLAISNPELKGAKVTIDGGALKAGATGGGASDTLTVAAAKYQQYAGAVNGKAITLTSNKAGTPALSIADIAANATSTGVAIAGGTATVSLNATDTFDANDINALLKGAGVDYTMAFEGTLTGAQIGTALGAATTTGAGLPGSGLELQIGDTAEAFNKVNVMVDDMGAQGLGIKGISVADQDAASTSIATIKAAINKVSTNRSAMGAMQNRLEHTINNLSVATENMTAAESRIRDVDMAKEMMHFTKNNVLSQAAQAMLAQANQQPQQVLQLLR